MQALFVIALLFAGILLLGLVPLRLEGKRNLEETKLVAQISWFRFTIYPRKEKKEDETEENTDSSTEKVSNSKEKSKKKEPKVNPEVKTEKKEGKPSSKKKKMKFSLDEIKDLAEKFLPLIVVALQQLGDQKKVERLDLEMVVGAEDPVEAVDLYGRAHTILGILWMPLDNMLDIQQGRARVVLSFQTDSVEVYGRFALSITVGKLVRTGVVLGLGSYKILKK